jgi:uncharacterized phage protein (TIGR01671 family)
MREILFRGKTLLGKWIEGDLLQYLGCGKVYIAQNYKGAGGQEVIPETVGQYTGLTDKNGKKIFEGDIVKVCRGVNIDTGYIVYDERIAAYSISVSENECLLFIDWFIAQQEDDRVWIEVIGNIHDNSELLKGGEG